MMSVRAVCVCLALATLAGPGQSQTTDQAERLYKATEYRAALEELKRHPRTAAALFLEGRCLFHLGDFKQSAISLEQAIASDKGNSVYVNWLGKALGRRAESANVFRAPGLAVKAKDAFERAVALDGRNIKALNDLFQYYFEAPAIMGGGVDRARSLVPKIMAADVADSHSALAQLAGKRRDYTAQESELRLAMKAAPDRPGKVADLAAFLARRGRRGEADQLYAEAFRRWPANAGLMYSRASLMVELKQDIAQARTLLKRLLALPLTPDDPSRQDARKLLKRAGG